MLAALDADKVGNVLAEPFDIGEADPVAAQHDRMGKLVHAARELLDGEALALEAFGDDPDIGSDVGGDIGMELRVVEDAGCFEGEERALGSQGALEWLERMLGVHGETARRGPLTHDGALGPAHAPEPVAGRGEFVIQREIIGVGIAFGETLFDGRGEVGRARPLQFVIDDHRDRLPAEHRGQVGHRGIGKRRERLGRNREGLGEGESLERRVAGGFDFKNQRDFIFPVELLIQVERIFAGLVGAQQGDGLLLYIFRQRTGDDLDGVLSVGLAHRGAELIEFVEVQAQGSLAGFALGRQ